MKVEKIVLFLSFAIMIIGMINKQLLPYGIFLSAISITYLLSGYFLATSEKIQNFATKYLKNRKEVRSITNLMGIALCFGSIQPTVYLLSMNLVVIKDLF